MDRTDGSDGFDGEVVAATPGAALKAIDGDSQAAGGPWTMPDAYVGSIGSTMFDLPTSKDDSVTVLLAPQNIDVLPGQALVRIESRGDERTYLGAVIEGPFAEPDGLKADSTPMVVATVQGGLLLPRFHGRAQVEIIGERLASGTVVPPRRRPRPNSPVFALDTAETASVLKIGGSYRLGLAEGFDDLVVSIDATSKSVFPRHLGVLGTTGGGKSTTVSNLIAKAQKEGMAVVVIDTEGEYCAVHEQTEDPRMLEALDRRGLAPSAVDDTHVLHLVGRDARNPDHPDINPFSLRFSDLSPHAVAEILQLNDAQEERFIKAFDITKQALDKFGIWPTTTDERAQMLEIDELESGYPRMTLVHLYDVVAQVAADTFKEGDPYLQTALFASRRAELKQIIHGANPPGNGPSWRKLQGRLGMIKRLNIFDSSAAAPLDYASMLQPGRVSILDLSDTDSPAIKNLVIAELLRGVQAQQERAYEAAVAAGRSPTPTLIFIEEAHEFLSADRIGQMPVLFQQVARIARRGRKRWLGLVFITQLPQHLPDEVLGLVNNWILHKIADEGVVNRLKRSIGGINPGLWKRLPSLAPGQAIVSFTTLSRPLQVSIDPAPCKLLLIE